VTVKPFVTNF